MLNKAIFVGRLTKDPELKSSPSGVSILNFTVAVQRNFKDASGERQSDFIPCVAFHQTAEFIAAWLKKGYLISVDGSIQTRSYEKDEKKVYVTEVIVSAANFVGGKQQNESQSEQSGDLPELPEEFGNDEDLPF